LYDISDLNVSHVSDCVKDGEAIIYQGRWGTGPLFIRGGTAHLWGSEMYESYTWHGVVAVLE